ncbi:hypothetical protein FFJ24_010620 [Pedobacter sp. KBS0701]|uniref:hypothetical protein n=1 Tax=Pedobacter sp. KBS0701 TaxID=2578106 RepID=UPI00110DFDB5|nr:hypothetical protein [Pedobacter sp. KBS0701]QDW25238.1 hypothetical protein FFJ24_010620 [Pedobacter sp. KBS0701]
MKNIHFNSTALIILFVFSILIFAGGCKKDQLVVNEVKEYFQVDHTPANAYDGGFALTLQPDGYAEVLPSGDIRYRGTYEINGSKIKVKIEQESKTYTFEIISTTEIREKEYGTVLKLK